MNNNKNGVLHRAFDKAREAVKAGDEDTARDLFDFMLVRVGNERLDGAEIDDLMEGIKVGVWLERAWYGLENNNLLLQ